MAEENILNTCLGLDDDDNSITSIDQQQLLKTADQSFSSPPPRESHRPAPRSGIRTPKISFTPGKSRLDSATMKRLQVFTFFLLFCKVYRENLMTRAIYLPRKSFRQHNKSHMMFRDVCKQHKLLKHLRQHAKRRIRAL